MRDASNGKGKALSSLAAENSFVRNYLSRNSVSSCPVGLRILAFRRPCPAAVCGVTGKLKNTSLSVLRGSAVKITNPFRVSLIAQFLFFDWQAL